MGIPTRGAALRMILDHYGRKKQELQAVQELSELILLLAARSDQRGDDYRSNIIEEIADVKIMLRQIEIMHDIDNDEIDDMIAFKIRRQLDRIEKEQYT